jgi:hypothetical protein
MTDRGGLLLLGQLDRRRISQLQSTSAPTFSGWSTLLKVHNLLVFIRMIGCRSRATCCCCCAACGFASNGRANAAVALAADPFMI